MNNIIGAEAAKLAGLQIDLFRKLRDGTLTMKQLEWFLYLESEKRNQLCGVSSPAKNFNLKKFLSWLEKSGLEKKLVGGLMGQVAEQEMFYRRFYGDDFRIHLNKISINTRRLPAIKAGLEMGCINYALVMATPWDISDWTVPVTGAEFFYKRLAEPLKKDGFGIWSETGTDRWTRLTLAEFLQRCHPVEPEVFDSAAFGADWVKEEIRVIDSIGLPPKVAAGVVEIIFTSDDIDLPANQIIVNKYGETVQPSDRSYVSAITEKVRVQSQEEGIVQACQCFVKDKAYLAFNTWEPRRDLIDHRDKGVTPGASVGYVGSDIRGFILSSREAGSSDSVIRLRLAL